MEVIKHNRNLLKGLFIGSLVGAAAGIVFAPKSRRELRSDIKGQSVRETKHLFWGARTKADAVFKSAKNIFDGRRGRREIIFRDLEEPDQFTAEA